MLRHNDQPLAVIFTIIGMIFLCCCVFASIPIFIFGSTTLSWFSSNRTTLNSINVSTHSNQTFCDYKGEIYQVGDSFNDECNTCNCLSNGSAGCTKKTCISESSSNSSKVAQNVCWNRARNIDGNLAWPDGCKGISCSDAKVAICTQALVGFSEEEISAYRQWENSLNKQLADCSCYDK